MRLFYNCLLVIVGLALLGCGFMLIAHFHPASSYEFKWPSHLYIFAAWLVLLLVFGYVYIKRTRWLETIGIFQSWYSFKAYVLERHWCVPRSDKDKLSFLAWSGLSEGRPRDYHKLAKNLYMNAQNSFEKRRISRIEYESLIKGLAWYVSGWPLHDEEDEDELESD